MSLYGKQNAFANVATATTDGPIIAAVAGKLINVLAVMVDCGATATAITFNSKPAGAGTPISATIALGASDDVVLDFCPAGWFQTNTGEGLSVTTGAAGASIGVQVVYELY